MNSLIINTPVQAGIHTFNLRTEQRPTNLEKIDSAVLDAGLLERTKKWFLELDINLVNGCIDQYSVHCKTLNHLMNQISITDYTYYRTDICIDWFVKNIFKKLYKVNLLLICLFAMLFPKKNEGQAVGHLCMLSKEYCDISFDNQYTQFTFYNKEFQTAGKNPTKARLEIRCLKNLREDGLPPLEFQKKAFKLLDSLPSNFEALQEKCNSYLLKAYQNHCKYCSGIKRKRDYVTEFLSSENNALTIFTREQLRNFLVLCGVDKEKVYDRAEYILRKTKIELFSKNDIVMYIEKLKEAMFLFFST